MFDVLHIKRTASRLLAVFALFFVAIPAAEAMRLAPMVAELTTTGAGSTARIEVGNVGTRAMPFETEITRVEVDANGKITESSGEDDFLVFPPQGLVPVSGQQMVRVQWVGPPIETTRAYYLAVKQLPVATDPTAIPEASSSVAVNVLYTMKTLLLVSPPGVTPNVKVQSVKSGKVTSEAPSIDASIEVADMPQVVTTDGISVEVVNEGGRHAMMSGATWIIEGTTVTGEAFTRRIPGAEVSQLVGVGYVPAGGGRRIFNMPLGVELDAAKPISVRFAR